MPWFILMFVDCTFAFHLSKSIGIVLGFDFTNISLVFDDPLM